MAEQPDPADASPALPPLKVVEPRVDAENPWHDDVLDRKDIAERLTSIVRGQVAPFVISLDGRWGTGKTFLLKRWQQDLENQGWQAIYYNAWEDDFANDPLLSVTGQLSEHFKKGALWAKARKLGGLVAPFVQPVASAASIATTGAPLPNIRRTKQTPPNHLADYLEKRAAKDELKKHLADLAAEVREETEQPLIFIIDELDRCRPTFAIELLERVKHIFDVHNIVFVFGINRGELMKSLESVYGEIDAGTYLRRFFDMEFVLPDPDPVQFCRHLVSRHQLGAFFSERRKSQEDDSHSAEFKRITGTLPFIMGAMGLSLRDMDYCVRLLSLAARDLRQDQSLDPELLSVLIALKVTNQTLYRRFVDGAARGADVINYMNTRRGSRDVGARDRSMRATDAIDHVEATLYAADSGGLVSNQIDALMNGRPLEAPPYLAEHHRRLNQARDDRQQLQQIKINVQGADSRDHPRMLQALAQKIDIHDGFMVPHP